MNGLQILQRKEKDLLLQIIKAKRISRTELQKKSDLKVANFYNTVDSLLKNNIIKKEEISSHPVKGRPSEILSLNADYCYIFSILITCDLIMFSICNLCGDTQDEEIHNIADGDLSYASFLDQATSYFERKKKEYRIGFVAIVSGINTQKQEKALPDFYMKNPEDDLKEITGLPLIHDNIARAAALGIYNERYSESHASLVFFNLSFGIGVGIMHSMIPEAFWENDRIPIGHWELDSHGRQCECGKRGCLITSLGANSIVRNALELKKEGMETALPDSARMAELIEAAKNGDRVAQQVFDEAATALVKAMRIIYSIIHFDVASIGGVLCNDNQYFYSRIQKEIEQLPFSLDIEENYTDKTSRGISYRLILELLS